MITSTDNEQPPTAGTIFEIIEMSPQSSSSAPASPAAGVAASGGGPPGSPAPCDRHDVDEYFSDARLERMNERAREENGRLNLNLGLPVDLAALTRRDGGDAASAGSTARALRPPVRFLVRLLDRLLSLIESPLMRLWAERMPLRLRQRMTFLAWGIYLPIHKVLIGRRSGLHKDVSLEYHALTSVMWWGRLVRFPITVRRMRFSLSQLHVWHPPDRFPRWDSIGDPSSPGSHNPPGKPKNGARHGIRGHLYEVYHQMARKRTPTGPAGLPAAPSADEATVTGQYVQHGSRPSRKVVLWIFGGAFLAGDSRGNLGIAEKLGALCGMRDVFLPDYRLVPEHGLDDAVHDVALAYEYLVYERGVRPEGVVLVGVSSGGGLAVLLMQALARAQRAEGRGEVGRDDGAGRARCVPMPAGAAMMGPFVDYSEPRGSMREYVRHDLIVNQSVYDEGVPYLETVLGSDEDRIRASPVYGNLEGLPPLCICVSEHEVVYDQAMALACRAKGGGVDVTVGVWKYMCHVFPLLCPFVPEGREGFDFVCEWIRGR